MIKAPTRLSCDFFVMQVDRGRVFLVDKNLGRRSVTNDAEAVTEWCQQVYPGKRVIYRDSMGRWDEMLITSDNAVSFAPYGEYLPMESL